MSYTNIITVGDLHLDWSRKFLTRQEHNAHISKVLIEATNASIKCNARMLVLLGDIFDTPHPTPKAIKALLTWLLWHKRKAPNTIVLFYPGNHDKEDAHSNSLEWLEPLCAPKERATNASLQLAPSRYDVLGFPVVFLPWQLRDPENPDTKVEQLLKQSRPSLIFAHDEVRGAKMDNGWLADGIDLSNTKHWWEIGHLHTPQELHGGRVRYVGTPTVRHWNHEPKGLGLLRVKHANGRIQNVQRRWLPLLQPYKMVECKGFPKQYDANTYYRVHIPVGVPIPDQDNIVSVKRIETKKSKKSKDEVISDRVLPPPRQWLLMQLSPTTRTKAALLLDSLKTKTTDATYEQV